jgi:hypothetical protein
VPKDGTDQRRPRIQRRRFRNTADQRRSSTQLQVSFGEIQARQHLRRERYLFLEAYLEALLLFRYEIQLSYPLAYLGIADVDEKVAVSHLTRLQFVP